MSINQKVLNIIVEKIETDYKEDVALLVLYNVKLDLKTEKEAGLDFYFIPKTEKAKRLSTQFIIDGISYDLFPMSWERLVQNAALDRPQAYLLVESEVVYYSSEEDLQRFMALKKEVEVVLSPKYAEALLNKAFEYFNETYIYLHNMTLVDNHLIDLRLETSKLIVNITNALVFVNQGYYKGGQGTNLSIIDESFKLKELPEAYEILVKELISAKDAKTLREKTTVLVNNTRVFLENKRAKHAQNEPFETVFNGYYEEFKSILTVFEIACKNKKQSKLFLLASYIHEEVSQFMSKVETGIWFNNRNFYSEYSKIFDDYFKVDFLDLIANEEYESLLKAVRLFEKQLISLLKENDIKILEFNSTESFGTFFKENR